MTARQRRALRGAAAAGVAVLLGAVSHTYGGGAAPAPWLMLAVLALSWPVATLLTATRLGTAGVGAAAFLSQSLLHVAFALTAGLSPTAATGHQHAMPVLGSGGGLVLPDTPMIVAHLIAAVAAFAVLAFGERGLRAIARGIRAALRRTSAAPRRPEDVPAASPVAPLVPVRPAWSRLLRRRGPPLSPVSAVLA